MRLSTDREFEFPFGPDEFWARISDVPAFPAWWPWLRTFDGRALRPREVWQCAVHPPLPYVVRFGITIDEVVPARSISVAIDGDIRGTAALQIEPAVDGCRVNLVADLAPNKQSLRILSVAARPVVRFGHDWVLDTGVRQFVRATDDARRSDR